MRGDILDPDDVAGFRRLTQAWALRRMWGDAVPLRAGAVFLREADADPGLIDLGAATLASFDRRLRETAARLLIVELGAALPGAGTEDDPWPKLAHQAQCGRCVHLGRCWQLTDERAAAAAAAAAEVAEPEVAAAQPKARAPRESPARERSPAPEPQTGDEPPPWILDEPSLDVWFEADLEADLRADDPESDGTLVDLDDLLLGESPDWEP